MDDSDLCNMCTTTDPDEMKSVLWWLSLIPIACALFDKGELVLAYAVVVYDSSMRSKWHLSLHVGNKEVARGKYLYKMVTDAMENTDLPEAFRAKCLTLQLIADDRLELRRMDDIKLYGLAALFNPRNIPGGYTEHRDWSRMRRAVDAVWELDPKMTHVRNMLSIIDVMSRVFDEGEIVMYAPEPSQGSWLLWGFVHEGHEIVRASAPIMLMRHLLNEPSIPDAVRAKCQAYLLLVTGRPPSDL